MEDQCRNMDQQTVVVQPYPWFRVDLPQTPKAPSMYFRAFLHGTREFIPTAIVRIIRTECPELAVQFMSWVFYGRFRLDMSLAHRVAVRYIEQLANLTTQTWSTQHHAVFSDQFKHTTIAALHVCRTLPSDVMVAHVLPCLAPTPMSLNRYLYMHNRMGPTPGSLYDVLGSPDGTNVWKNTLAVIEMWKKERAILRSTFNSAWIQLLDNQPFEWRQFPGRVMYLCMQHEAGCYEYNAIVEGMFVTWGKDVTLDFLYRVSMFRGQERLVESALADMLCKCEMAETASDFGLMPRNFRPSLSSADFLQFKF